MVNHVTTNPFFTPTQYGASDACSLLGCSYQWTGSASSNVPQMVSAFNTAIAAGVDGIACAMIDPTAFTGPTKNALAKGIPVLSYNADEPNGRLAYIGQDLFVSGQQMGAMIKSLVPSGTVALFIATPGSANIQPRIDGAKQALAGSATKFTVTATGAAVPQELTHDRGLLARSHQLQGHLRGRRRQHRRAASRRSRSTTSRARSSAAVTTSRRSPQELLAAGYGQFTIDQQPYLQGFLPILELFLYKASGGLSGIADVDTGLKFLNPTTVDPLQQHQEPLRGHRARRLASPRPNESRRTAGRKTVGNVQHD